MADSLAGLEDEIEAFVPNAIGRSSTRRRISRWAWPSRRRNHGALPVVLGRGVRALTPQKRDEVANEIGDVLIYLLRLSRTLDIDSSPQRGQARAQPPEVSGRQGQRTRDEVRRLRLTRSRRSGRGGATAENPQRGVRRAESVVDVDDGKPGRAARERRVQRRAAALGNAVAHRRRHGDHRARNEPGQHAEERAFHAGDGDDDAMPADLVETLHEPPQPGHAHVGEQRRRFARRTRACARLRPRPRHPTCRRRRSRPGATLRAAGSAPRIAVRVASS